MAQPMDWADKWNWQTNGTGQTNQLVQQGGRMVYRPERHVSLSYNLCKSGARRAGIRAAEEQARNDQLDVGALAEQLRPGCSNDYFQSSRSR